MIFKELNQKKSVSLASKDRCMDTKQFCKMLKREYESLSEKERSVYENLSQKNYDQYLIKYQNV